MQPGATNPAVSATLPQSRAGQMGDAAPFASDASKPFHANDGPALQLMPRAAMPLPSNQPESPKSDYGGEYCMRLPVDDKAELSSAIIEDTLAALPVPPHAVSHVQGPILEVHQVNDHSVDIKIVHSFRASYVQPIDEVRQTAALAWQQRALESEPEADKGGSASDTSSGSTARQQWHQRGRGVHLHRPHSRHHQRSHSNSHTHGQHHHHHHNGHHRVHSVEQCVECTELVDDEECMLPPGIKRCAECVVHEHEHDASTDTEQQQPSSNTSSFGVPTQPKSRSSAATAEPAAAEKYEDAGAAHAAGGGAAAAAAFAAAAFAAAAAAGGVGAGSGAGPSPFAAASPFGASPFQAAAVDQQPFSQPGAHTAAAGAAGARQQAETVDADFSTPQRRPPRYTHQQAHQQDGFAPVVSPAEAGRQHDKGRLSVEVLRGGDSRADSGNTDTVVSPTAISDASDDVQAQIQQWQRQQGAHDRQRLGWRFEQQQLLQQLLQQQSSAVLYPEADSPRHGQQQEQQEQQQGVHVRLMHKHTAHGHEQVRVSPNRQPHADVTPPDSPQHHQHQQQQEPQLPQSEQQLQLVRQEQQWMHSPKHKQQQQDAPWEQKINQLDMNVLRPPAGFTPLSGDKLPHYVLAQEDLQQQQQQLSPRQQQQQATGTIVPARAPQADRFAPHPGLVAHLQGKSPAVRRHPALGFQPRCEWELDPRKVLVGRRLAVGGFAEVFLGKYEGTVVAIKRLLTDDASTIERFVSEVRLLARLRHPNLILFMGYCITPELCIVSEYMSKGSLYGVLHSPEQRKQRAAAAGLTLPAESSVGGSGELVCDRSPKKQQLQSQPSLAEGQLPLADEIRHQQQSLDPKLQRVVAISVARGMAYLHSRCPPILHLDLKSPNILLDDRWRVKITDFGLSRARQKTFLSSTAQGGTPEWMAPEVLRCEDVAEPADVYSYGVVLWELITGRPPWENYNPMQVVAMVGFRDLSLPLPASATDMFLLDMCRRCLHRVPEQRPTFEHIVSELDQHYGPPAWSAHAQPLLPPTMRLPLPAAAAAPRAASAEQQDAGNAAVNAGGSQKEHAVAAATAALAVEAVAEADVPSLGAAAEAKSGTFAAGNHPVAAAPAGADSSSVTIPKQQQQQLQDMVPAGAASAATAPPKLFSPFGGAELPPWSVESAHNLGQAQQAGGSGSDSGAAQVQQRQQPQQEAQQQQQEAATERINSTSTAPPKLFSPFGGGVELPPWSVEPVDKVSGGQHAPAEAAAAVPNTTQQQQQQEQQTVADGQGASAAPGKLISPFGGGAELPWSVDSVASLSGTPAHMQDVSAGQAPDAVRGPSSRPRALRQASSSDTSSSSTSSAADRQHRAAGGLGGQLGSSMAVSTQPGSVSSAAVLHMQKCMAPAGPHPAAAGGADGASPEAKANGIRQQQHVQQVARGTAPADIHAAAARSSSPAVRQAAADGRDDANIRVSASNRGAEDKLDSRESSPFEEVQFPAGVHLYLTPLKVGSGYHGQAVAASGTTDGARAAAGSGAAGGPQAAAAGAAAVPPAAAVGTVISDPFAQVADQPLSSSSGSSAGVPHAVVPPGAVASAPAAAQQRSRQLVFGAVPCTTGGTAGGSWTGQPPAGLQVLAQGVTATVPAGAARNGPVSAPCAAGTHAQAAQHGEAWHLPLDAAATGSWTHQSMTGLGSSNLPSDGSFMRSLWPSMTGTDPSLHSLGLPVVLDSPRQHDSSSSSHHSKPLSAHHSPVGHGGGASGSGVAAAPAVHQQDPQLPSLGQEQQQVYQVWPVLYATEQPHVNGLQQGKAQQQQQPHQQDRQPRAPVEQDPQQPARSAQQQQQDSQQGLQPKGSGQHGPTARSTSFQRKGRFMVSTMTPEPPAGWDSAEHFSKSAVAAAGAAVGAAAAAHAQAVAGDLGTSLPFLAAPATLHGPGGHWGPFGTVMQPGWPLLGSSVSAPPPNVDLMSGPQQQRVMMMQHEQGLVMQLSAPAKLGVGASQPGTPSTTPTATTPVLGAAGMPPALVPGPLAAADGHVGSADALPGRMSDPACRNLAGKGYWGSGIMHEPSGADSNVSMRCSHEGIDRCTAALSLSPQALLHAAGSSGELAGHEQQQLPGGRTSSNLWASMLQQVSNSNTGGLCYRSGRFHVTVEQLQAWQQRQQELQQQHAHLPHKSNSTGALLAAAGLAAAESPVAQADVLSEGAVVVPAPQQPQQQPSPQQQQPLLQRQPSRSMHVSSSCSSLKAAALPQQQVMQAQATVPAALQSKQQQRGNAAAGASATQPPAATASKADQPAHAEENTDTKRLCDLQSGGSAASSIGSPSRSIASRQASSGSSTSCLKLKTVAAAKASPTGSLANPTPPGAGKPPVVPCKTPSPAATPCLSPKLQRAKSRDYCKGRFQVHESPVVSHARPDQKLFAPAFEPGAGSGPSHTICVAELQHLQKQALAQLPELQQVDGPPQLQPAPTLANISSAFAPAASAPAATAVDSKQAAQAPVVGPVGGSGQSGSEVTLMPRSAGNSPLTLKVRTRASGSSGGSLVGSSGQLSDVGGSITPTAVAAAINAEGQVGSDDGGKAAAAAAAAVVQQRGRFTVRQESRPSSRPSSAHGSKAGSPRGSTHHHAGLSKLGSRSAVELTAAAAAAPAQPAGGDDKDRTSGSGDVVQQTPAVPAVEQQQQQFEHPPMRSSTAGSDGGSSCSSRQGAEAAPASGSVPVVADHPQLPPIRTVSKKGRFVVTQLTPPSTACCTPKSAGAATTPTAEAAAAGGLGAELAPAVTGAAAELLSKGELSVSSLGPLVTCPVCAVAQVMPQLPHQLSGQLLGLVTDPSNLPQQAGIPKGASEAAAAAACDAIAAAVSETQLAAGLSTGLAGAGSSSAGAESAAEDGAEGAANTAGVAGISASGQAPLHTCSSCGAPLPPMSQQDYKSAAAAAAAGVLDAAAAAAAGLHPVADAAGAVQGVDGSASSSLQSSWHEALGAPLAQQSVPGGEQHAHGASPRTPQGLLAMAAAKVLAARQQQQLAQMQRHQHHQQQQHRVSHDASSGPSSSSRTPGQHSGRRSFEPPWHMHSFGSTAGGQDLFSESSCQHSGFSSGRSSNSSIAALAFPQRDKQGMPVHAGPAGEVVFGAGASSGVGAASTSAHQAAGEAVGGGSESEGSSRCRTPVPGCSPKAAATPHASAADSPMRWAAQQRAAAVLPPVEPPAALAVAAIGQAAGAPASPAAAVHAEPRAAGVAPAPAAAEEWPRSHAAEWIDVLSSGQASSSSAPGSSRECTSPDSAPAQ